MPTRKTVKSFRKLALPGMGMLVRYSKFNHHLPNMKIAKEFKRDFPDCFFARVIRVGSQLTGDKFKPDTLVVIKENSGVHQYATSLEETVNYWIVNENEVLAYGNTVD